MPTPTTSRRPAARPATPRRRSAVVRSLPPLLRDPYVQQIQQQTGIGQGTLLEALPGPGAQDRHAVHGAGRRRRAGRAAGERDPAQRDPDRAGAAAARPARPRVARPRARRASAPTACRARSPASCSGPIAVARDARRPRRAAAVRRRGDPRRASTRRRRALGQALLSRPGPDPRDLRDRVARRTRSSASSSSSRTPNGRSAPASTATSPRRRSATATPSPSTG